MHIHMLLQNDIFSQESFIIVLDVYFGVDTCVQMPVRWIDSAALLSKMKQSGVR